jgi:xanthine dehydrogenase iron-sulfur cluster and FAD-binding subunit A
MYMPVWNDYYTASSIEEALSLLNKFGQKARIIAGGTDLIVEMRNGRRAPEVLIDITRIPSLDSIVESDNGKILLGPAVTHNQIVASDLCMEQAFPLVQACWDIGSPMIRNRGTIAGNIITASPANDAIPPLLALEAKVELASLSRGVRSVPLGQFITGVRETIMAPDEMVTGTSLQPLNTRERGTFYKLGLRKAVAISVVNAAVVVELDGMCLTNARIAVGSVAPTVYRAAKAEKALIGAEFNKAAILNAAQLCAEISVPIDDVRSSARYRKRMVYTVVERALMSILNGTEKEGFSKKPLKLWGKTGGQFPKISKSKVHHQNDNEHPIETIVNGRSFSITGANDKTLLSMLREDLGLTGSKEGCSEGDCGSCTLLLDGIAVLGCLTPAVRAHGAEVVTIEGINGKAAGSLSPMQQALIDEGAVQCGYCTPGIVMAGEALLAENLAPAHTDIRKAMAGNLCRCTGYYKIIKAVESAAAAIRSENSG